MTYTSNAIESLSNDLKTSRHRINSTIAAVERELFLGTPIVVFEVFSTYVTL